MTYCSNLRNPKGRNPTQYFPPPPLPIPSRSRSAAPPGPKGKNGNIFKHKHGNEKVPLLSKNKSFFSTNRNPRPPTARGNMSSRRRISSLPQPHTDVLIEDKNKKDIMVVSSSSSGLPQGIDSQSNESESGMSISLVEQKKRQWAKEREELSTLWNPWAKENERINNSYSSRSEANLSSPVPEGLSGYSSRDHYLPPIPIRSKQDLQNHRPSLLFTSTEPSSLRRRSLNHEENGSWEGKVMQLKPTEQRTTYHREGNAEWLIFHTRPDNSDGSPDNTHSHGSVAVLKGKGDGVDRDQNVNAGSNPQVIIHKITMDSSEERTTVSRTGPITAMSPHTPEYLSSSPQSYGGGDANFAGEARGDNGSFINPYVGRPPPPAMRSSVSIGITSPRVRYGRSYEDLSRKEKEQWLNELERQREEQRLRKLIEKDDKRSRWGDRGVGIGRFWDPSDPSSRLPSRDNISSSSGSSPPPWLQRSLQLQGSQSHPNLYDGPLPSDLDIVGINGNDNTNMGHDLNFNRSFVGLSTSRASTSVSDFAIHGSQSSRSFVRADLDDQEEKENRLKANQEYLEEVKKQIEERKRLKAAEKERERQEEMEHEMRMARQRELEMKRIEMEKRERNPSDSTETENVQQDSKPGNDFTTRSPSLDISSESPIIPSHLMPAQDAYELAIARRQTMMLEEEKNQSQNFHSDNLHFGKGLPETGSGAPINSLPIAPKVDQCLMTDSDHLYERTLTPTHDRRSRSIDGSRSREFGTQTELSEEQSDTDKSDTKKAIKNLTKSKSSTVLSSQHAKKDEKPRWGANPTKKIYLKQSEKDPRYQLRLKRRQHNKLNSSDETISDFEARNSFTRNHQLIPVSSMRTGYHGDDISSNDGKNGTTFPRLGENVLVREGRAKSKNKPRPRRFTSETATAKYTSEARNLEKSLGHLQNGMNSVAGSGESTDSGLTSPSFSRNKFQRTCSTGDSNQSSMQSNCSDNIPMYCKEFVRQLDFDEIPTVGRKASASNDFRAIGKAFAEKSIYDLIPQSGGSTNITSGEEFHPLKPRAIPMLNNRNQANKLMHDYSCESELDSHDVITTPIFSHKVRSHSPPVPALARRLKMGADDPDKNLNLKETRIIPSAVVSPYVSRAALGSGSSEESRISNLDPRIDIDIAITPVSNPDFQELLQNFNEDAAVSGTDQSYATTTTHNGLSYKLDLPHPVKSARRVGSTRPHTNHTDLSLQAQEELIQSVMGQQEVQAQLSARQKELADKGIIEFSIKLPANWTSTNCPSGRSRKQSSGSESVDALVNTRMTYHDPFQSTERKDATAQWLQNLDDETYQNKHILSNLTHLKQGIRIQQQQLMNS